MPDIELSLEAQRSIDDFARSERDLAPSQLKIPEIIPGCVVVDIDPHGVGLGTLPRLIQVRINEFLQLVLWSGFPTLAVGSVCTVIRRGTGNTYQVSGVSGATGILTDADVYRYHWVYDVTLDTLIAYDTIVGATAYPALASGDYILMKPGTFDESVTQIDGVTITEQVPGTVIIHSTSADVAVTCVDGGYLQCKEIRSTRGAGNNAYAVDISGLGGGESCDIYCEQVIATQTGATGAENAHAIHGGGLGTLHIHANHIETYFTGSGGGSSNHTVYFDDDTLYIFSDVKATFAGTAISWTFGVYGESGGTGACYLRGHAEAVGDDYCAALYSDGPPIKTWGDCDAISTFANSWVSGVEGDDGTIEVFGNCSGIGKKEGYGAFALAGLTDTTAIYVYGNCYGETTDAGATEASGAMTDGIGSPTLRVHGDAIGVDVGGASYGCHCDAGTLTHTCGVASGVDFDEYRSAGTLQVFMVEYDSYSGTITSYYPLPRTGYIGEAGGATGRITFDFTGGTDYINFASAHVGINEAAPGAMQQITIDNAANIGFIVKAAAAQTANLTEWRDSAGNIDTYIDSTRRLRADLHTNTGNFFVGDNAGNTTNTGNQNIGIGTDAVNSVTSGSNNIGIGTNALTTVSTASSNVAIGVNALLNCNGASNFGIGTGALQGVTSGIYNVAIGINAGQTVTIGTRNVFVGVLSASAIVNTASYNVGIGLSALANATGDNNVAIGYQSGAAAVSGNVFLGNQSGAAVSNRLYIENSNSANPLIYGEFDNDLVRLNGVTALTNTIHDMLYLRHQTSGAAAALFGIGEYHELEDSAGNVQVASEAVTLWTVATSGSESPLRRWTTYPKGIIGPGYGGVWTWDDVDAAGITIIPDGAGDVTVILTGMYSVSESAGGTAGGTFTATNGSSVDLYDDGVDVLTLTVNAGGDVDIARTAGAATFDVVMWMVWL